MRRIAAAFLMMFLATAASNAQDYRATLMGTVTDATGAAVAGAQVTVANTSTGIVSKSVADSSGSFTVPFLVPGMYALHVRQQGFNTFARNGIVLQANDRQRVDVKLTLGQVATTVVVTSQAPLLDTGDANNGQAISNTELEKLPSHFLTPTNEIGLSPGVVWASDSHVYFRPFDTQLDYSINGGGRAENNLELDGISDNSLTYYETRPSGIAYQPPLEGTQETKTITNIYDAEYGRTLGGIVNLVTKSGTNELHGAAYYAMHRTYLDANSYANNQHGIPRAPDHVDQYGFEIGGPVLLPKIYEGRNRTFFMFAYEHYYQFVASGSAIGSVPTAAQRMGDFSQTFNASGKLITIYDPNTTRPNPVFNPSLPVSATNAQYIRDKFAKNQIPTSRLNPVALKVLGDIPQGNVSGNAITGLNNWFAGQAHTLDYYNSFLARLDHLMNDRWKVFGRWDRSRLDGGITNPYQWTTPARQYNASLRWNDGAGLDAVGVLSPQSIVTARIGYHRFVYGSNMVLHDLSYLGLPVTSQLQQPGLYPLMSFTNYIGTGRQQNDTAPYESYQAAATLIKNIGRHALKAGIEYQLDHFADTGVQNSQGAYSFTQGFTQANPQVSSSSSGNAIASFLLGDMATASANLNAAPYITWHYLAPFVQDDWQVNSRLTINLGLRWDYLSPPSVRHNAQNRGFDFTTPSPVQIAGMNLKGGLLFAGVGGQSSGAWDKDYRNWQPRFGFAYQVAPQMVFRGGVGRSYAPLNYIFGGNTGFAQTSVASTTTPDFQPLATLSNPFPAGLIQPTGATLGLATAIGSSVSFTNPNWRNPYVWQFSLGFQYEVTPTLLLDVSYVGSQTSDLGVSKQLDYLTTQQLSLGAAYLGKAVPNPFRGVLPSNTTLGSQPTITQAALLTPYPQFTSVTENNLSNGSSWYNSLQLKAVQRSKSGFAVMAFYTWSKNMDASNYLNPQDVTLSRSLDSYDIRHYFSFGAMYELPFGPNKPWLNSGGIASYMLQGWEISASGNAQTGMPLANPTGYFIQGNPALSSGQNLQHWFNTSPQIWVPIPPYTLTNVPVNSSSIRVPATPQFDATVTRYVSMWEGQKLRFRLSAYNATNTPLFGAPNTTPSSPQFGQVQPTQTNLPRQVDIGILYSF